MPNAQQNPASEQPPKRLSRTKESQPVVDRLLKEEDRDRLDVAAFNSSI